MAVTSPLVFLMARADRAMSKHRALTAALLLSEHRHLELVRESLILRADLLREQHQLTTADRHQRLSASVAHYYTRNGRLLRREEQFVQRVSEVAHG